MATRRVTDLERQIRQKAWDNHNGLFRPRVEGDVRSNFPLCQTCRREVEAAEMVDLNRYSVTLRARCHGKEDTVKVDFPFAIGGYDPESEVVDDNIRVAMRSWRPFDPSIA